MSPDAALFDSAAKPALSYPFKAPERGHTLEVMPGIQWIRMPLPYALNHINLWVIDDADGGWALVDTGTRTDETVAVWRELFDRAAPGHTLSRIFVTHMHPDHVGMAGWLTRKFNVRLWMTRLEYLNCRVMTSDTGREAPFDAVQFYRRAGWGEPAIESYRARFGNFGKHIHQLPDSFRRLTDGEVIRIGAHDWKVIVGNGHSPEHACLYCPDLQLLISGDQVLPKISSNVSVYPVEPDANPMADWLSSLAKLRREVPEDVLVLPAHGEAFRGLHLRIDALAGGQARVHERLMQSLREPRRAVDTFVSLFNRPISQEDTGLLGMATGESLACLNYLIAEGRVAREIDKEGVAWYRALS